MKDDKKEEEVEEFVDIFKIAQQQEEGEKKKKIVVDKLLKPEPIADAKLSAKLYQALQQLLPLKQVRKGVNQLQKQLTKGTLQLLILAADCDDLQIIMHLPPQCQQKRIQYCFVASKDVLGRACGIKRPVVAAGITSKEGSQLNGMILELKDKVQQLFV